MERKSVTVNNAGAAPGYCVDQIDSNRCIVSIAADGEPESSRGFGHYPQPCASAASHSQPGRSVPQKNTVQTKIGPPFTCGPIFSIYVRILWCGEGDLNPHEISPASTSTYPSDITGHELNEITPVSACD